MQLDYIGIRRGISTLLLTAVWLAASCSPPSEPMPTPVLVDAATVEATDDPVTATVDDATDELANEATVENVAPTTTPSVDEAATPNRLIHEQSPYLLQHAYNPINWYPWGEEAFETARRENKPIFLSIGYSTCHWCHVMEEESFSDPAVAALMNDVFVAIKVDREERPDIDAVYMNVAMLLNGSGGWPLNIIMTPDQKPFFAATYIPKESRFQLAGLMDLIPRVQQAWTDEQDMLLDVGEQITRALNPSFSEMPGDPLGPDTLALASEQLALNFDPEYGGFGPHPKFPSPHNLLFLLRQWQHSGDETLLHMVETTLQAMRKGGLYDDLGYGFHRYSTDAQWLVPHFEKMLYDQAMLAMAYIEAYLATGDERYRETAVEIFTYVQRDMTSPEGGFYSAEDADSEGEEGVFYLWTIDEIEQILDAEDAALAIEHFGVTAEGNYFDAVVGGRTGKNILHVAERESNQNTRIEAIRQQLFAAREARIHPYKDDKILTDWNGLMIAALARAAQAFDEPAYAQVATDAADFLLANMRSESGRLLHRYRNGEAAIPAKIDDYAFLIWGLLDLYEATFDLRYLEEAISLNDEFVTYFWDASEGGFFYTAADGEPLLTRPKEGYDGAVPSGNSAAMLNLVRLGRITGDTSYDELAADLALAFSGQVQQAPSGFTHLLNGLDFAIGPSLEIVVVGRPGESDTEAMLSAIRSTYTPNKVVLLRLPGEDPAISELADFTRYQYAQGDAATAYVCRNYVCEFPTTEIETMLELIEKAQDE